MKLNWFSPLLPAKTDIAHYTSRILPALAKRMEVVLWTDQAEWDPALERFAEVRRYDPQNLTWDDFHQAGISFFNIGNNAEFHLSIWQVSRQFPGIVLLHDVRLFEFFAYCYRWIWGDRDGFLACMERYYGSEGRRDGEDFWEDRLVVAYMVEHYPLTPLALEAALGAIVHTETACLLVQETIDCPVAYLPLPYPSKVLPRQNEEQRKLKYEQGPPYRLIMFGYIHSNRRLEPFLEAFADLPEKQQFRLDIYGELWNQKYIRDKIKQLGLRDRVAIHGFVPEPELNAALAGAHLAINLRYPSMGEASGSQLRIWSHALPSIVTRTGWYADIPETAVRFVRLESEAEDIQTHLRDFIKNPLEFMGMGSYGHSILENRHSPHFYTRFIQKIASNVPALIARKVALGLVQRTGEDLLKWTTADALEPLLDSSSRAIYDLTKARFSQQLVTTEALEGAKS